METFPLFASLLLAPLLSACTGERNQCVSCGDLPHCLKDIPYVNGMMDSLQGRTRETLVRFSPNISHHIIERSEQPVEDLWYTDEEYENFEREECDRLSFTRKIRARVLNVMTDTD